MSIDAASPTIARRYTPPSGLNHPFANISVSTLIQTAINLIFPEFNEQRPPLKKIFAKWLNQQGIPGKGWKNIEQVADLLSKLHNFNAENFKLLKTSLEERREISIRAKQLISEKYPFLIDVDPDQLEILWNKGYKTLIKTIQILNDLPKPHSPDQAEKIETIKKELNVWCLHFLVTGAKIPILNPQQKQHLPFHEYHENTASYYRGDGGAIIELYKKQLTQKFPEIQKAGVYEPVKNGQFSTLMESCCTCNHHQYKQTYDAIEINKNERYFFDATDELIDFIDNPKEGLNFLKEKYESLKPNENVVIGGVIKIRKQDIYICYPPTAKGSLSERLIDDLKNFQGANGYYPDMMILKHHLFDLEWTLENLFATYPFSCSSDIGSDVGSKQTLSQINVIESWNVLNNIVNTLNNVLKNPFEITKTYLHLVMNLLGGMTAQCKLDEPFIFQIVTEEINSIIKNITKIGRRVNVDRENAINFQYIFNKFTLIFESISFLFIFFENTTPSLRKVIQNLPPYVNSNENVIKESFCATSCMSALGYIAEGLAEIYVDRENDKKGKALFMAGSYYEFMVEGGLKDYITHNFDVEKDFSLESDMKNILPDHDVLFTDLHPNAVTLPIVKTIPVRKLIEYAMVNRTKERPFTLALDTSTTLFFHQEIGKIINDDKIIKYIESGQLLLAVTGSLAKFPIGGLDKHTGGMIQFYYQKDSALLGKVVSFVKNKSDMDPFSPEAERFFSHFLGKCSSPMLDYFNNIRKNTQEMYRLLNERKLVGNNDNPIQIGIRDDDIVMIGIHFDWIINTLFEKIADLNKSLPSTSKSEEGDDASTSNHDNAKQNIAFIMQYYLYAKCEKKQLPIALRSSFSYPRTTLIECSTAVRMIVGSENQSTLAKYADCFVEINEEIKNSLANASKEDIKKLEKFLSQDPETLKKCIIKRQPALVKKASEFDFMNFLDWVYSQESILH
jgi:hypothetical protein